MRVGSPTILINRLQLMVRKGANEKLFQSSMSDKGAGAVVARGRGGDQQAPPPAHPHGQIKQGPASQPKQRPGPDRGAGVCLVRAHQAGGACSAWNMLLAVSS